MITWEWRRWENVHKSSTQAKHLLQSEHGMISLDALSFQHRIDALTALTMAMTLLRYLDLQIWGFWGPCLGINHESPIQTGGQYLTSYVCVNIRPEIQPHLTSFCLQVRLGETYLHPLAWPPRLPYPCSHSHCNCVLKPPHSSIWPICAPSWIILYYLVDTSLATLNLYGSMLGIGDVPALRSSSCSSTYRCTPVCCVVRHVDWSLTAHS